MGDTAYKVLRSSPWAFVQRKHPPHPQPFSPGVPGEKGAVDIGGFDWQSSFLLKCEKRFA